MAAILVLWVLLFVLEWFFSLSPWKGQVERLMSRMGSWYMLVPFHYILRLAALGAVLLAYRPALWPVFRGGVHWGFSALLGFGLILVSYPIMQRLWQFEHGALVRKMRNWHQSAPVSLWRHTAYIIVHPGFVEELLFRWFFVAALWPVAGWWTLLLAPILNILWHLPVWVDGVNRQGGTAEQRWSAFLGIVLPASVLTILLTAITIPTQNLLGAVLAHAFGDWVGTVLRRRERVSSEAA